jgi:uncharacterized protein (TIGR00369 family)
MGRVHGGVYATLVETTGSVGATLWARDHGQVAVGVNNSTDFLRPIQEGRLDIVAVPVMQGRTQQLWHIEMTRPTDGVLVAQGRLRLQNVSLLIAEPRVPYPPQ